MTIEQIRDACEAQPFRLFTIHLADGRTIPVVHRDFIARAPSGRTIDVYQEGDRMNIIDLPLVTDLEFSTAERARGKRK
jgi:hypothetical protein